MVATIAESQSRAIANTIRILCRQGHAQRLSLRRLNTTSAINNDNPTSSKTGVQETGDGSSSAPSKLKEVSRDMSSTAESSRSAQAQNGGRGDESGNSGTNSKSAEDKQFAEIFDTLNESNPTSPPRKQSTANLPPRPESIADRLVFDGYSTPSPRYRGVHSRLRRSSGQTPKEAETFNEILAGIFADLNHPSVNSSSSSSFSQSKFGISSTSSSLGRGESSGKKGFGISDAYSTTRSGSSNLSFGLNNKTIKRRANDLRQRWTLNDSSSNKSKEDEEDESQEDLRLLEELELLKEEMQLISTDVELIEWSKNRVFKPLTQIPISSSSSLLSSSDTNRTNNEKDSSTRNQNGLHLPHQTITYSPTYPKILSHLLRTLRVNYNSPHLVLSLFNYAQNISLESYLSGCLTEVYNEVLLTRWESFRDLNGVELGIREMEIMGIDWDQQTSKLISKIYEEISKDLLSSSSSSNQSTSSSSSALSSSDLLSKLNLKENFNTTNNNNDNNNNERKQGGEFSNLISSLSLNSNKKENEIYSKYGSNVLQRLNKLDEKIKIDVIKQEKYYENLKRKKRKLREQREKNLENTFKDQLNEEYENKNHLFDGTSSIRPKNRSGFIEEPKEGERAFI
ncbi:uncharacterized protein L201_003601 [Kwoniella dendrophila CBS 6074]|uniref:Mtf2-like C-terminal domain-containing protein n=1 Tax=Kwoniella dendrophila CBS 6074 TaxID=1295534 RepID=A0AAX4JV64_9TREE